MPQGSPAQEEERQVTGCGPVPRPGINLLRPDQLESKGAAIRYLPFSCIRILEIELKYVEIRDFSFLLQHV